MSAILNEINYFWKLGFNETQEDIYAKKYKNEYTIKINTKNNFIEYFHKINVIKKFSQHNFIVLETINRCINQNWKPQDLIFNTNNKLYDFKINSNLKIAIKCFEFEVEYDKHILSKSSIDDFFNKNIEFEYLCFYTSRLKAGLIEYKYKVFHKTNTNFINTYSHGLFEKNISEYNLDFKSIKTKEIKINNSLNNVFEIKNNILNNYKGKATEIEIPNGVIGLRNAIFSGNTTIKEVKLPKSLKSLGGDTFYNCINLQKITIPKNVESIGDNPFANCPNLNLLNESSHFIIKNNSLFDEKMERLIYCSISHKTNNYNIPNGVISIGKHAFYNCKNINYITIPASVKIIENNPFSNLPNLKIINNSNHFIFKDGALYNKTKSTLFYYEHNSKTNELKIPEGVKIIGRHSFFNCKTITKITIPKSVEIIGYNPFTKCPSLSLINHSPNYVYENGALYDKEKTELIYYSLQNTNKTFKVPETVTKIGRSAFFDCLHIEQIIMHKDILIIERSAFANCINLKSINIQKSKLEIGQWAFLNCNKLIVTNEK